MYPLVLCGRVAPRLALLTDDIKVRRSHSLPELSGSITARISKQAAIGFHLVLRSRPDVVCSATTSFYGKLVVATHFGIVLLVSCRATASLSKKFVVDQ